MRKKFLAVALAATMVIGLVGCGNSSSSSNNATTASNDTQATEEFNPDTVKDSKTIEDIRKDNGDEVKVKSGLKMGAMQSHSQTNSGVTLKMVMNSQKRYLKMQA